MITRKLKGVSLLLAGSMALTMIASAAIMTATTSYGYAAATDDQLDSGTTATPTQIVATVEQTEGASAVSPEVEGTIKVEDAQLDELISNGTVEQPTVTPSVSDNVPAADKTAIEEYKPAGKTFGKPVHFFDLKMLLTAMLTGTNNPHPDYNGKQLSELAEPVTITIDISGLNLDVSKTWVILGLHDTGVEEHPFTIDQTNKKGSFKSKRFSTFALAEVTSDTTGGGTTPGTDGSTGGTDSSVDWTPDVIRSSRSGGGSSGSGSVSYGYSDSTTQKEFWDKVAGTIRTTDSNTVTINARGYDKLSSSVMRALRNNPDVTLVIKWNGGKDIVIPAGMALNDNRAHYLLSDLADYYGDLEIDTVADSVDEPVLQDAGTTTPSNANVNPGTGR